MTTAYPTASEGELVDICLGPVVLPRAEETNDDAGYGNVGHLFLQRIVELGGLAGGGREKALETFEPDQREMLEAFDVESLPLDPDRVAAEVALAWNPMTDTGRELGRGLSRDYSGALPEELVGTVDLLALLDADGVIVIDWKFLFGHVTPVRKNRQMRRLALLAARAYGRRRVVVRIIRPRENARPWVEEAEFDAWDLGDIADEQRAMVARVDAARAPGAHVGLVVGDHCNRCHSNRFCPAYTTWVSSVAIAVADKIPDLTAAMTGEQTREWKMRVDELVENVTRELTPDMMAVAHGRLKALEYFAESFRDALRTLAMRTPFPLKDGRWYGARERTENRLDGRVVWGVVAELYGDKLAWEVADVKVTLEKLRAQARGIAQKRKDAGEPRALATQKAVVEEIEQRAAAQGGWKRVPVTQVREYSQKGDD